MNPLGRRWQRRLDADQGQAVRELRAGAAMSRLKAGEIVDSLDAKLEISDGQIVTDLMLIAKVANPDGETAIVLGTSGGMDWITQLGIVTAAGQILNSGYEEDE